MKQVKLTEKQVESFVAAHADKDFAALIQKLLGPKQSAEAKVMAELDGAAAKHGFKDYAEYVDVFNTIGMAMNHIDPQTKALVNPEAEIKKEIEEVNADKSIAEERGSRCCRSSTTRSRACSPSSTPPTSTSSSSTTTSSRTCCSCIPGLGTADNVRAAQSRSSRDIWLKHVSEFIDGSAARSRIAAPGAASGNARASLAQD